MGLSEPELGWSRTIDDLMEGIPAEALKDSRQRLLRRASVSDGGVSAGVSRRRHLRACSKRKFRTFSVRIRDAIRPRVHPSRIASVAQRQPRVRFGDALQFAIDLFVGGVNRLGVCDLVEQQRSFDVLRCPLALLLAELIPIEIQRPRVHIAPGNLANWIAAHYSRSGNRHRPAVPGNLALHERSTILPLASCCAAYSRSAKIALRIASRSSSRF